jgi:hypothetical protein
MHPGAISSDLFKHWNPFKLPTAVSKEETIEKAAQTLLYLSNSMEMAGMSGGYYYNNEKIAYPLAAIDENLIQKTYKKSLDWTETPIFVKKYGTA